MKTRNSKSFKTCYFLYTLWTRGRPQVHKVDESIRNEKRKSNISNVFTGESRGSGESYRQDSRIRGQRGTTNGTKINENNSNNIEYFSNRNVNEIRKCPKNNKVQNNLK